MIVHNADPSLVERAQWVAVGVTSLSLALPTVAVFFARRWFVQTTRMAIVGAVLSVVVLVAALISSGLLAELITGFLARDPAVKASKNLGSMVIIDPAPAMYLAPVVVMSVTWALLTRRYRQRERSGR